MTHPALERATAFCAAYGLRTPVMMAPMARACPPTLSAGVTRTGGMFAQNQRSYELQQGELMCEG